MKYELVKGRELFITYYYIRRSNEKSIFAQYYDYKKDSWYYLNSLASTFLRKKKAIRVFNSIFEEKKEKVSDVIATREVKE